MSRSFSLLRTPNAVFPEIEKFRIRLNLIEQALFVPVRPRKGGKFDNCFNEVKEQVRKSGGSQLFGWMIWIWPYVMTEAVLHSVWQSPKGELVDVTPKQENEQRILFIPDSNVSYAGKRVDNVRIALWDDPRVHKYIRLSDDYEIAFIKEYGATFVGDYKLKGQLLDLFNAKAHLELEIIKASQRKFPIEY
jgi:hypothetical protein